MVQSGAAPPEEQQLNQLKWKELCQLSASSSSVFKLWQRGVCVTSQWMRELNCLAMEMSEWIQHISALSLSSLKSQTVWKMAKKKSHPTNHSRALCAISAEECQHFSGFWSLFGTHTHTLEKKEMGYYVKDCIFFGLHAFPTHSRFSHSLHLLINGHSVRGSREVKLITLIDFEANKPKTHTHPPRWQTKKILQEIYQISSWSAEKNTDCGIYQHM